MEIEITNFPANIKSFFFSPKKIVSDKLTVEYLARMRKYIFGTETLSSCEKLGLNVFDLVFVNDKPFYYMCRKYLRNAREKDKDTIRTALLLRYIYKGEFIRISGAVIENEKAYIKDPEAVNIKICPDNAENFRLPKRKPPTENFDRRSETVLESIRLTALKYGMNYAISYKELIDKYNYRRFSTNLSINRQPVSIEELISVFSQASDKILTDLSNPKIRIIYSVMYAMKYGGFALSDIYSKNTVFEIESFDKERRLSELANEFINIVYNGNRMEIVSVFIEMIMNFVSSEMPEVNMNDLGSVMDNYSLYYAAASVAAVCEQICNYNSFNEDMKEYFKKRTFTNYWTVNDRIMLVKQYSTVVSFCYKMTHFDYMLYLEDPEYQAEILYSFEASEKFAGELKKSE